MRWNITVILLAAALILSGCSPDPQTEAATSTPDPCTGWECELTGVVFYESDHPGQEAAHVPVQLEQVSHCSRTRGKHQTRTSRRGEFHFDVFLHDTDSFWFDIEHEGYQPVRVSLGGFDCLYCACQPLEIILQPQEP